MKHVAHVLEEIGKISPIILVALLIGLLSIGAFIFFLIGPGNENKPVPVLIPPVSQPLTIGIADEPQTLIPVLSLSNEAKQILGLVFDGLTNPKGLDSQLRSEYVYGLARAIYEVDPNDKTLLRVELKRGIKWHNGGDFTARDVTFTWDAIHQSNSPLGDRLDCFVDDIRMVDDFTLNVRLREEKIAEKVKDLLSFKIIPQNYQPEKGIQGLLPKDLNAQTSIVHGFNWKPVGTGPYMISDRPSASEFVLKANPLPVCGKPQIDEIHVKHYPGWDVIVKGLTDGSINLAADVPPEYFLQLDRSNLTWKQYFPYSFYALVYNVSNPPTDNTKFRLALNHATDREQLAAVFLPNESDVGRYVNESIYPHNYEHVKNNPVGYATKVKYDQAKAREILANMGGGDRRFHLLYCSLKDGEYANSLAQTYRQMLSDVGLEVILENAPNKSNYSSRLKNRKFQVAFVFYDGLDHFYELFDFFEQGAPRNHSGFVDPGLTRKLSELRRTLGYDNVGRITREIHAIIDSNAPICTLFTLPKRAYHSANLQNLVVNPESYFDAPYDVILR